ncbi:efflux RND transporter periplasmic adaptor subunit [Paraglaciecola sp.]|uniref:efflux RND transporter periplasmic adaptor subunit n=1 Tax=Paraglaciecola sp. TaxID=1920173 RepID=UPI003EF543DD
MLSLHKYFLVIAILSIHKYSIANTLAVDVVIANEKAGKLEIELSGSVSALNDAKLTSLESGVVKTINFEAGDKVIKGQELIKLDDTLALIQLEQANAAKLTANVAYQEDLRLFEEIVRLAKQKVVAKTLLAERKANAANSKAKLSEASAKVKLQQEIVNRHIIIAPFTGIIANRNIDLGEWVNSQSRVLQLVSDNVLRIFIDIPQEYFKDIQNTSDIKVLVTPDTAPTESMALTINRYIQVSNPISRTFKAQIDLPTNSHLVSGMSARVRLLMPMENTTQVNLPKTSLKKHPDGSYSVYSVNNGKVKRLPITLLNSSFNTVTVEGVMDGTAVIVSGNDLLIEGQTVTTKTVEGVN